MRLLLCDADRITAEEENLIRETLPERYAYACRCGNEKTKKLSLAASFLLIQAFSNTDEKHFCKDEYGKPYITGGKQFNLSHSGNIAVLATDDEPLGVDVEEIIPTKMPASSRMFTSDELEWIDGKAERFFQLWTIKEAVAKACGRGLSFGIFNTSALFGVFEGKVVYGGDKYFIKNIFYKNYCICVASKKRIVDIEIEESEFCEKKFN